MKMNAASRRFVLAAAVGGAFLLVFDVAAHEPVEVVLSRVPEKARARPNPLENDPEAATAGQKLFEQHCAECHGETAGGSKRGPNLRAGVPQAMPGEIFWILTNGVVRHGMPAWSKLPEAQRWQIVAFLRGMYLTGAERRRR